MPRTLIEHMCQRAKKAVLAPARASDLSTQSPRAKKPTLPALDPYEWLCVCEDQRASLRTPYLRAHLAQPSNGRGTSITVYHSHKILY